MDSFRIVFLYNCLIFFFSRFFYSGETFCIPFEYQSIFFTGFCVLYIFIASVTHVLPPIVRRLFPVSKGMTVHHVCSRHFAFQMKVYQRPRLIERRIVALQMAATGKHTQCVCNTVLGCISCPACLSSSFSPPSQISLLQPSGAQLLPTLSPN